MEEQQQRILQILAKLENDEATPEEILELDQWYQGFEGDPDMTAGMTALEEQQLRSSQLKRLNARLDKAVVPVVLLATKEKFWKAWMVAASILFVISAGAYFFLSKQEPVAVQLVQQMPDFKPGSNRAMLSLSNGKTIILDDASKGKLAAEGSAVINKTGDGQVVYDEQKNVHHAAGSIMNTMTTPRGGQYQLTLADGTQVWLNAASSITYPAAFTGKDRQVVITGEVYFQVAHNAARPFLVKSAGQTVRVLGTHFNINAYDNEGAIKTTLLEGSVAVSSASVQTLLKPGQQAAFRNNRFTVSEADVDGEIAWKQGYFDFVKTDIQTLMRQVSRWYNVDVVFEGPISKETFTGRISRNRNISQVLKIVQGSNAVQLTFQGRRIMVR